MKSLLSSITLLKVKVRFLDALFEVYILHRLIQAFYLNTGLYR